VNQQFGMVHIVQQQQGSGRMTRSTSKLRIVSPVMQFSQHAASRSFVIILSIGGQPELFKITCGLL
jgi:hypothetical protein